MDFELLVILGPTASGKTKLAVDLAEEFNGEIISADSRQVYRGMDIGTGKDLTEYQRVRGAIVVHGVDRVEAGEKYNVRDFQVDFFDFFSDIKQRGFLPILCGGTGLYLQSVLLATQYTQIPQSDRFREQAKHWSEEEITAKVLEIDSKYENETRKRKVRALEIQDFFKSNPDFEFEKQVLPKCLIVGLDPHVSIRRKRISVRLAKRLHEGLLQEAERLINEGLSYEMMDYYGLEYRYLARYIQGIISYVEMVEKLEIEIHRFAKRQMTFFRSMEKKGVGIEWFKEPEKAFDYLRFELKNRSLF